MDGLSILPLDESIPIGRVGRSDEDWQAPKSKPLTYPGTGKTGLMLKQIAWLKVLIHSNHGAVWLTVFRISAKLRIISLKPLRNEVKKQMVKE